MSRHKATVLFKDYVITPAYLEDVAHGCYGKVLLLAGIDDEVKVDFHDFTDPDIGNQYASVLLAAFERCLGCFRRV